MTLLRFYFVPEAKDFVPLRGADKKWKIAFLDLDGTMVTRADASDPQRPETKANNWVYLGPVPQRLDQLHRDGWIIVIVSNQSSYNAITAERFSSILSDLKRQNGWLPFVFIAQGKQHPEFRKPNLSMITLFLETLRREVPEEAGQSYAFSVAPKLTDYMREGFVSG